MKKMVAMLVVAAFFTAGCTGSFGLTKKVYEFHRGQEDKWMDELIFLGCVILPVYSLATLGDAIIFNTIEFWTGDNPIDKASRLESEDLKVVMKYMQEDQTVSIESADSSLVLARTDDGVIAMDADGTILYRSVGDEKTGISIYDANDNLVEYYSPKEIALTKRVLN